MARVDAVIFDLDGLLLDTERISRAAWNAAATQLDVTLPIATLNTIIGRRRGEVEHEFRAALGDAFDVGALYRHYAMHYESGLASTPADQLRKPGVLELLDWLDATKIKRAIATSSLAPHAADKLARSALASRFPIVVTGEQVARSKPAPDIFVEAAWRVGVAPHACVAFEDSDLGLEAALDAGMRAIAVPDLKPLPASILTRTVATLATLLEAPALLAAMREG
jgi:beta-phosphoglucomutase-like phosphatase (HAD superfamily)